MIGPPIAAENCCQREEGISRPVTGSGLNCVKGSRAASASVRRYQLRVAMFLIASRLRLNRNDARHSLAKLGIVVPQRDFRFLNGVQVRIDDDDSENRILIVGSVQFKSRAAEVLAVHENLLSALRIFRGGMAPADQFLSSGGQQFERREVAVQDRQHLRSLSG